MQTTTLLSTKPWQKKMIIGYLRQEKDIFKYEIAQLIYHLIAKYFNVIENFQLQEATMIGPTIKGLTNFATAIGSIPFQIKQNPIYKWTFKIRKHTPSPIIGGISFGIIDNTRSLQVFYNEFGECNSTCGKLDICYYKTLKFGQMYYESDQITLMLAKNKIHFLKNGVQINEAFDYIPKQANGKFKEFFCHIRLNKGTEIDILDFDILI